MIQLLSKIIKPSALHPSNIHKTDENGLYPPSLMVKNFRKEFQQRNLFTSNHSYGTNSLQAILNSFLRNNHRIEKVHLQTYERSNLKSIRIPAIRMSASASCKLVLTFGNIKKTRVEKRIPIAFKHSL